MSEFGGLRKHEKTQHALKNNTWAGSSHHVVATVLMYVSMWLDACDPCERACCASSCRFEPWWPWESRLLLLKFFIITVALEIIMYRVVTHAKTKLLPVPVISQLHSTILDNLELETVAKTMGDYKNSFWGSNLTSIYNLYIYVINSLCHCEQSWFFHRLPRN